MSEAASISGYDGAQDSAARSTLIFPTNSRTEYNRVTRRKLLTHYRALESNFAFTTRIRKKVARCVAGKGIFPHPVTRDAAWNKLAKAYFERWAFNPHTYSIDGSCDLAEDQRFTAEQIGAGDGEAWEALVRVKEGGNGPGRLYVQPLDPFEIESPFGAGGLNPRDYDDGVRTDAYLRPLAYSVRELPAPGPPASMNFREIPARSMIHVFCRRRRKQLRGLPPLYSALNDGHDAMDTLALEKATAKLHALLGVAKIVKPEKAGGGQGMTASIAKALAEDGTIEKLEEKFHGGAVTLELAEGEDVKLLTSTRPSNPIIEGVKLYCWLMGLGADLPFSVLWGFAGMGGTPTRADMEDAQGTFEINQDQVVWRQSEPIYVTKLADGMLRGELPLCRDPYWWASDWHGPAKITVDYGRSASANIDLTRNGLMSHPRYFEERGMDAYAEMRKQIDFLKWLRGECDAAGIPIEMIIEPTPGAVTNVQVQSSNEE